ncbi:hypothetical protein GGF42_000316, partial [Coemansia sp. RSA 2424]
RRWPRVAGARRRVADRRRRRRGQWRQPPAAGARGQHIPLLRRVLQAHYRAGRALGAARGGAHPLV